MFISPFKDPYVYYFEGNQVYDCGGCVCPVGYYANGSSCVKGQSPAINTTNTTTTNTTNNNTTATNKLQRTQQPTTQLTIQQLTHPQTTQLQIIQVGTQL